MTVEFSGEVWYWKGPAPHHFVTVPEQESRAIKEIAPMVTYGWGMVPVVAKVGGSSFYTALFERDGRYIVPIKLSVRKKEKIEEGDTVRLQMDVGRRA